MIVRQSIKRFFSYIGPIISTHSIRLNSPILPANYHKRHRHLYVDIYNQVQIFLNKKWLKDINLTAVFCTVGNILKHSSSKSFSITLIKAKKGCIISIKNNGKGFDISEIEKRFDISESKSKSNSYFKHGGLGWRAYRNNDVVVHISKKGKSFKLLYMFNLYRTHLKSEKIFNVDNLYLKGFRIRPQNDIRFINGQPEPTSSVFNIALVLLKKPLFSSKPIDIYVDKYGRNIVYEGRHRVLAHCLAGRKSIKGRFVGRSDPNIAYQKSPGITNYYRKKFNKVDRVLDVFIKNNKKDFKLYQFTKKYILNEKNRT